MTDGLTDRLTLSFIELLSQLKIYIKFNIKVHIITEFTATNMNMRSITDFFLYVPHSILLRQIGTPAKERRKSKAETPGPGQRNHN